MVMTRSPRSQLFTFLLTVSAFAYGMAALYVILGWLGVQSLPTGWHHPSLPVWAVLALICALGSLATLRRKRWGILVLVGAWASMATANLVWGGLQLAHYLGTLLAIGILTLLLPEYASLQGWQRGRPPEEIRRGPEETTRLDDRAAEAGAGLAS